MEKIRPFIIRRVGNSLLPPDAEEYNDLVEERIGFVQSANIFIVCMLCYECIRLTYYFFDYKIKCPVYAYLCATIIVGNLLWIGTAAYGFTSINSRKSADIGRYYCLQWFILFIRLMTYFAVWALMSGYQIHMGGTKPPVEQTRLLWNRDQPLYLEQQEVETTEDTGISDQDKLDITCAQLNQAGLMMIQAIIETVFQSIMIYIVIQIKKYIRNYETNQEKKQRRWNMQASVA